MPLRRIRQSAAACQSCRWASMAGWTELWSCDFALIDASHCKSIMQRKGKHSVKQKVVHSTPFNTIQHHSIINSTICHIMKIISSYTSQSASGNISVFPYFFTPHRWIFRWFFDRRATCWAPCTAAGSSAVPGTSAEEFFTTGWRLDDEDWTVLGCLPVALWSLWSLCHTIETNIEIYWNILKLNQHEPPVLHSSTVFTVIHHFSVRCHSQCVGRQRLRCDPSPESILSAVLEIETPSAQTTSTAVGNSLPWRYWVPLLQPGVGRDSVYDVSTCVNITEHHWTPAVDTAPESRDSSSSLFATFFYTHRITHRIGNRKVDRRINIINAKRDSNKLQIQENHKKTTRNPQEIRRSLEHLWNMGLLSAFPNSDELLWTSLDSDGLCTQGCQSSLNLCELLGTSWNTGTRQWAESVSDCFWVLQHVSTQKIELRSRQSEILWLWPTDQIDQIDQHITTYHNISQHKQSYAKLCKAMQSCVPSSPFLKQTLVFGPSNSATIRAVLRLPRYRGSHHLIVAAQVEELAAGQPHHQIPGFVHLLSVQWIRHKLFSRFRSIAIVSLCQLITSQTKFTRCTDGLQRFKHRCFKDITLNLGDRWR